MLRAGGFLVRESESKFLDVSWHANFDVTVIAVFTVVPVEFQADIKLTDPVLGDLVCFS